MWWKILLTVVVVLGGLLLYGSLSWNNNSAELFTRLEKNNRLSRAVFDSAEIASLPEPVRRYLNKVLKPGQPAIKSLSLKQSGTFNMAENGEQWKAFTAEQLVTVPAPGFVWNAKISMLPGIPVFVYDAYVAGEGILKASIAGLVTVMEMDGTPELARGELMRFLAEAPLYPTVLLPGNGITWQAIDSTSARATLNDGLNEVALTFHFGEDDLIESVKAASRERMVGDKTIPTPWLGRWWNYREHEGLLIPTQGEVSWLLPGGRHSYWRATLNDFSFDFSAGKNADIGFIN